MNGLRVKRLVWTIVFLGVTLVAIVMECIAGLWHPTGWTIPWTEYLARYVPWPIQLTAYVILAVWLPFHFWRHDHMRGVAYKQGYLAGTDQMCVLKRRHAQELTVAMAGDHRDMPLLGLATTQEILEELHARGDVEEKVGDDRNAGGFLRKHAETLLAELPPAMRAYRTVDGR